MQGVTHRVLLVAPTEQVWPVLGDVSSLPLLSPSIVEVDGPGRVERVGDRVSPTVTLAGRRFTSTWTVTAIDEAGGPPSSAGAGRRSVPS